MDKFDVPHLETLKRLAVERAQAALRRDAPDYVTAFRRELVRLGDPQKAEAEAERVLPAGMTVHAWSGVLTRLFDVEYGLHRLSEAYSLIEGATPDGPEASRMWWYHFEHWLLRADAVLDRTGKALSELILAMPDAFKSAAALGRVISTETKRAKKPIARYRQGVAHGLGAGVDGITNRWLAFLALPTPDAALAAFSGARIEGVASRIGEQQRREWLVNVSASHRQTIGNVDALCELAVDALIV